MDWEDLFNSKFLMFDSEGAEIITGNPDEIKSFIDSLLEKLRGKYYYHIENSLGTKEADYIDKMINNTPEGKKI